MASYRKSSAKQRALSEHDEPQSINIRFDYSDTYLDNEDLDFQLEDQTDELHREQYRMCVESDAILKKTKQGADEMLQLKNAIKNRDPYESSNRVTKSADLKRQKSNKTLDKTPIEKQPSQTEEEKDKDDSDQTEVEKEDVETEKKEQTKPLHTLTMFLLSLQALKRTGNHARNGTGNQAKKQESVKKPVSETTDSNSSQVLNSLSKRPSSYHAGDSRSRELSDKVTAGVKRMDSQYGIHVKKDHTRSRRKLEEISKLEQDSKYGYVNKYEERRKRLLAACKDTKSVDDRIKLFLKDVDDFKMMSSADNSLEKVLMRTKSAHFARSKTFVW